MRSVYFETFGCQMNNADSDTLAHLLYQRGYRQSSDAGSADLIIVNTCSVRDKAERRARSRIESYAFHKKRGQKLWVIGCMAQRLGETLRDEIPRIDRVIGAQSLETIACEIDGLLDWCGGEQPKQQDRYGVSVYLPIMRGCDNECAYCIVPLVRGRERSRPLAEILDEARRMVDTGTRELTLLGQNVNSYRDGDSDFSDCIAALCDIHGLERIRFTTSHPKDLSNRLIATMANLPKMCHHFHLPIQSGSSKILALMNRNYTREHYLERLAKLREAIPDIDITTDILVGFPGETHEDFLQTYSLVEQVQFTAAFMFAFSIRPGTPAANHPDQIDEAVKIERLEKIIALQTDITKSIYARAVGSTLVMLPTERQTRRTNALIGYDNGFKRILVDCTDDYIGKIITVRILKSSGMTLLAERI